MIKPAPISTVALENDESVAGGVMPATYLGQDQVVHTTPASSIWAPTERSFAGVDILATAYVEGRLVVCDNISAITYSTHREKVNVPTLGRSYARRRTRGMRTIAGSIVWLVKDRAPLWRFLGQYKYDSRAFQHLPLSDSIPPFDITLTYANEYGHVSVLRIYGIDITDEGQTHSIQDMITENVMQYQAFDIDPMMPMDAENGELPWMQAKDGTFYRSIGDLATPFNVGNSAAFLDYNKYQRAVSWLAIFNSDWERQVYTYWAGTGETAMLNPPAEVAQYFAELGFSIGQINNNDLVLILNQVRDRLKELTAQFGSFWNVEANRAAIMDGTIPSANPFDQTTYNLE